MRKNQILSLFLFGIIIFAGLSACTQQQNTGTAETPDATGVILNHYAAREFVAEPIPAEDLDIIIQAGIRAPSAANRQPWFFTIVENAALAKEIVPQNEDGNILIVVSALGDGKTNNVQIFDCGLAVQNMYLAAQALGYGSRIYTGPINNVNENFKAELSLPEGHSAVALVRVGKIKEQAPDAVSAASSRKDASEIVTYIK